MTTMFVLKARAVWLFGIALAAAGVIPVLWYLARLLLPESSPVRVAAESRIPLDRLAWMPAGVDPALVPAAVGIVALALGAMIAKRQLALIAMARRRREEALRRVPLYREDATRKEPFIGPAMGATAEEAELQDAGRRRVA